MQKKQLQQLLVGIAGACLCLFVFGTTAFAQFAVPAGKTVVTDTIMPDMLNTEPGLLIVAVEPASPAAKAGLVRGDIVLKINDKPVNNLQDMQAVLSAVKAGDTVTATVQHGDDTPDLKVTLGERQGRPFLGIMPFVYGPGVPVARPDLPAAPEALAVAPEVTPTLHARVLEVVKDSPAEKGGLQAGDAIVSINGKLVTPEAGLARQIKALAPGDVITLEVQQGEQGPTVSRTVTLGKSPDQPTQAFLGVKVAPVEIRLFKMQLDGSMQGNRFNNAVPVPYLGWSMPMPFYGMPPILIMPYGGGVERLAPGLEGGNEGNFPYPGTPYGSQNFSYRMPLPAPSMPPILPGTLDGSQNFLYRMPLQAPSIPLTPPGTSDGSQNFLYSMPSQVPSMPSQAPSMPSGTSDGSPRKPSQAPSISPAPPMSEPAQIELPEDMTL